MMTGGGAHPRGRLTTPRAIDAQPVRRAPAAIVTGALAVSSADRGSRDLQPTERVPGLRAAFRPTPDNGSFATAAEQMFFYGAPLAHVVAYCEHLRMANISRRYMQLSRRMAR